MREKKKKKITLFVLNTFLKRKFMVDGEKFNFCICKLPGYIVLTDRMKKCLCGGKITIQCGENVNFIFS